MIAMALIHIQIIHQMDVKIVFLNGEMDEEVYMKEVKGLKEYIKIPLVISPSDSHASSSKPSKEKTWFRPCKPCGSRNHFTDDCYSKPKCSMCGSTEHMTKDHLEQAAVKRTLTKLKASGKVAGNSFPINFILPIQYFIRFLWEYLNVKVRGGKMGGAGDGSCKKVICKEIRLWATSILSANFVHLTHELIGIHVAKAKKGLRKVLTKGKGKRLSLYEQPLQKVASQYGTALFRFTQKNILRVRPKGTRVTFMNSRPLEAWIMVLRWLRLICRMFQSNGGCGYVKKPDSLMRTGPNGEVFDLKAMIHVKKTLKVRVYMDEGWHMDFSYVHFDKFSPPDFYTKIVVREQDEIEKDDYGGQTRLHVLEFRTGMRRRR
ncbi:phosphoinositide phospholipase C 6-like protein [Tanacetum coccineum]